MRLPLLWFLLATAAFAQDEGCVVEGQVVNAGTGEPIRKAQILLRGDSGGQEPRTAVTDAAGKFAIAGVRPGRYFILAERNGYVRSERGARTLTLAAGQQLKNLEFRMLPQAVIAGRVLDEDGDPVPGVNVQALHYGYVAGKRMLEPAQASRTNDLGEYRLAALPPGTYYVGAVWEPRPLPPDGGEEGYATTYHPNATMPSAAAPMQLAPGTQLRGVDIAMGRARTVQVSGRVLEPDGQTAARNALVMLMPRDAAHSTNSTPVQQGRFTIGNVSPGQYYIAAHRYSEDTRRYTVQQAIDVGNVNVENIVLTLAPGFDMAGRVRVEGSPEFKVRGLQVTLQPKARMDAPMGGRVGEDGTFLLTSVSADYYWLRVFGLSGNYYVKGARLGEQDALENPVAVAAGAGPLEIVLSPAGGQVEAIALDDRQQPAAAATVVLVPDEKRRERIDLYKSATTDQYGRAVITGIAPGDYRAYAWAKVDTAAWQDAEFLKPFESFAAAVTVRENGRESAQLKLLKAEEQ